MLIIKGKPGEKSEQTHGSYLELPDPASSLWILSKIVSMEVLGQKYIIPICETRNIENLWKQLEPPGEPGNGLP